MSKKAWVIFSIALSLVLYLNKRRLMFFTLHSQFSKRYILPALSQLIMFISPRRTLTQQSQKLKPIEDFVSDGINFRDMLLGVAVGDAFGAGIEMQSREWITKNVDFTKYINARYSEYAINYVSGLYTDDTEMTLGVIHAMLSGEKISEALLMTKWKQEFNKGKNWLGICRQGHGSIKNYLLGATTLEEVRQRNREAQFPGNAPTMRAIPIGFLPEPELQAVAIMNATATHPHPKAIASSLVIAWGVRFLIVLKGASSDIIKFVISKIQNAQSEIVDKEFLENLRKVDLLPDYHEIPLDVKSGALQWDWKLLCGKIDGFLGSDAMHTAFCVLYIIKYCSNNDSSLDLLKYAIRIGGDVDSVASIVMGIYGGWKGLNIESCEENQQKKLPKWLIDPLEGVNYLQEIALKFKQWYQHNKDTI